MKKLLMTMVNWRTRLQYSSSNDMWGDNSHVKYATCIELLKQQGRDWCSEDEEYLPQLKASEF
jgi:hypothetical protein